MLLVTDLEVAYGAAPALWGVSIAVQRGELVSVVGPNGAGKSTLINAIAGLLRARSGTLSLDGRNITRLPPHRFCAEGIALVPEGRRLFATMSVLENLEIGSLLPQARAARAASLERAIELFPVLKDKLHAAAASLSGGQQQMVAIARALMARPKLLLLDEPSLGLSPLVVHDLFAAIRRISADGITILLVEQNVATAMQIAQRVYVLEEGRIAAEGTPETLMVRPEIRRAYLGSDLVADGALTPRTVNGD
jgi:branched-chain amino acid transport system ATP-binding protein